MDPHWKPGSATDLRWNGMRMGCRRRALEEIRNSKLEIRNKFEIPSSKPRNHSSPPTLNSPSSFEFGICVDLVPRSGFTFWGIHLEAGLGSQFRISSFEFDSSPVRSYFFGSTGIEQVTRVPFAPEPLISSEAPIRLAR